MSTTEHARIVKGRIFRIRLEQQITRHMKREHALRDAPPEVVHRRVNGETVIGRRLLWRRTIPTEDLQP